MALCEPLEVERSGVNSSNNYFNQPGKSFDDHNATTSYIATALFYRWGIWGHRNVQ